MSGHYEPLPDTGDYPVFASLSAVLRTPYDYVNRIVEELDDAPITVTGQWQSIRTKPLVVLQAATTDGSNATLPQNVPGLKDFLTALWETKQFGSEGSYTCGRVPVIFRWNRPCDDAACEKGIEQGNAFQPGPGAAAVN
ncbi:Fc.00g104110.m01.CDS01 [Cosmosporella sp. VM-42]